MIRRAWVALLAAACATSCAAPLMTLPSGPGVPAADGPAILASATAACRSVRTMSAEISISGRVAGRKIRRGRLLAGLAAPASAYLDAPAPFGASVFIFSATGDSATVLLPRDRRVLEHGVPAQVLEAVSGVALTPADLRDVLTGCDQADDATESSQRGENWRVVRGATDRYLQRARASEPWRLVAVVHRLAGQPDWRAEYRDFSGDTPRTIRIVSDDAKRFELSLALSQVELNVALDPSTFQLRVPPGFTPITLDELRSVGPLDTGARTRE